MAIMGVLGALLLLPFVRRPARTLGVRRRFERRFPRAHVLSGGGLHADRDQSGGADGAALRQHVDGELDCVLRRAHDDSAGEPLRARRPPALADAVLRRAGAVARRQRGRSARCVPRPVARAADRRRRARWRSRRCSLRAWCSRCPSASAVDADRAFGANVAGAMVGGLSEYSSMLLGFQYVVLVALGFYVCAAISRWRARDEPRDQAAWRSEGLPPAHSLEGAA